MEIIETIYHDRAYKDCLCCVCGVVSQCTPTNDFYETDDHGEGIVCERCFREYTGHKLKAQEYEIQG